VKKALKTRIVDFFEKQDGHCYFRPMEVAKGIRLPKSKKYEVHRVVKQLEKESYLSGKPVKKGGKHKTYSRNGNGRPVSKKLPEFELIQEFYFGG
jgi:hypothetical protein